MEKYSQSDTSGPELKDVEETTASLMATLRNYGVFPPHHASTLKMVAGIHQHLTRHLNRYGDLVFEINKGALKYKGELVYDAPVSDENPAFILFRDGIRWIEFQQGLSENELLSFFRIFNYYRVLREDPEDDLVTVLWRADFKHINYKASDELWDTEPVLDLSEIHPVDPEKDDEQKEASADETEEAEWGLVRSNGDDQLGDISISSFVAGHELWSISSEEKQRLTQMVEDCVNHDRQEETVRFMILVLGLENDPQIFESILGFLKEEFQMALTDKNFMLATVLLRGIKEIQEKNCSREWVNQQIEKYFSDISELQFLHPLQSVWAELPVYDASELKEFTTVLQLLPPKTGKTLATMLDKIKIESVRSMLVEIITSYAVRDHDTLVELLFRPEEDLVLRLLHAVRNLSDRDVVRKLLRQAVQHPGTNVRSEAGRIAREFGLS